MTVADDGAEAFVDELMAAQVPYSIIGSVGGERLTICGRLDLSLDELRDAFEPALERAVHGADTLQPEELFEG